MQRAFRVQLNLPSRLWLVLLANVRDRRFPHGFQQVHCRIDAVDRSPVCTERLTSSLREPRYHRLRLSLQLVVGRAKFALPNGSVQAHVLLQRALALAADSRDSLTGMVQTPEIA